MLRARLGGLSRLASWTLPDSHALQRIGLDGRGATLGLQALVELDRIKSFPATHALSILSDQRGALGQLASVGLGLRLISGQEGEAALISELRQGGTKYFHVRSQLDLAWNLAVMGATAEVEKGDPPRDLEVKKEGETVVIEVKTFWGGDRRDEIMEWLYTAETIDALHGLSIRVDDDVVRCAMGMGWCLSDIVAELVDAGVDSTGVYATSVGPVTIGDPLLAGPAGQGPVGLVLCPDGEPDQSRVEGFLRTKNNQLGPHEGPRVLALEAIGWASALTGARERLGTLLEARYPDLSAILLKQMEPWAPGCWCVIPNPGADYPLPGWFVESF